MADIKYGALKNVQESCSSTNSVDEETVSDQRSRKRRRKKIVIGSFIVVLLAGSWVGAQQFGQSAVQLSSFNAPYFTTWIGTCWMMLCFPLYAVCIALQYKNMDKIVEVLRNSICLFAATRITLTQFFLKIVPMNILWLATNYVYLFGLTTIAATDASAIFASNVAFVYMLSLCLLKENLYVIRILACIFCINGVVLFGYAAGFEGGSKLLVGSLMALAAAFGAALYKVIFKLWLGTAGLGQVSFFLSLLGVSNTLFMWTIFLILHFTGIENFKMNDIPWSPLLASSVLGLVFNFTINFGVSYTFPLFISIAMMLGVPLNAVVDVLIRHVSFNGTRLFAALLIILGFAVMLLPDRLNAPIHAVLLCRLRRRTSSDE